MNIRRNYYKILSVDPAATEEEIKSAYKKLARRWHPDVNDNSLESRQMMKDINEAYEVLSDSNQRDLYNKQVFGAVYAKQIRPKPQQTTPYSEPTQEQREKVRKNYQNKYKDAASYYHDFEKNIEQGRKYECTGTLADKFYLLKADALFLAPYKRIFILPWLFVAAVLWHGADLISNAFSMLLSFVLPNQE